MQDAHLCKKKKKVEHPGSGTWQRLSPKQPRNPQAEQHSGVGTGCKQ